MSIRLFVPDGLRAGAAFALSAGQAHYLGAVMRRAAGDEVRLFNGRDGEWAARLEGVRKDRAGVTVLDQVRIQAAEPDIWLAFAPLKRDATDLVVEKATELGASAIIPVMTERTNAARVNVERLRAIATEAAEQCERLTVPEVREPVTLEALMADWPAERTLFVALERAEAPALPGAASGTGVVGLLVGPEGGFSGQDRALVMSCPAVRAVSLGPRILRAETAAIVGLALLQTGGSE